MKNLNYIFLFTCTLVFFSCKKDVIESEPLQNLKEDNVFDPTDSIGFYTEQYLNGIYANIPVGYNRISSNYLDAGSDDAIASALNTTVERFTRSTLTSNNNPDDAYAKNYAGIRSANILLANMDKINLIASNAANKGYWKAEARFLRSLLYFELIKRYGGVPLIGDKVFNYTDDMNIARNTYDECVNYIVTECDAIIPDLRTDPIDNTNLGRATKGAAMALKAKALLYAASPLFNVNNDLDKWKAAYTAAEDITKIATGKFALETSYINAFTSRTSREIIFAQQQANNNTVEYANAPVGYIANNTTSQGQTSPTEELVRAFEMANGKSIDDNTSGYIASNPYAGRDPRFYLTIFHNGMTWLGRPVETFDGGKDRPGGVARQTRTGYYARKFLGNNPSGSTYATVTHNFPIFRYAEVLLNFAEAKNEFSGPAEDVFAAVESIRRRAGLSPFAIARTKTKDELREVIRHERRVEMAFEEQRFWDIRRWKIAEQVLNKPLTGIRITKNATTGALTYTRENVITAVFTAPKMYLYPLPYSEVVKSDKLIQNTGW
ncbi:RagB/SusD family nutrient uptake outer membrane protein [Pedobacter frigoris]|uniref:RagB/SusD family nutrient uptake outer membrane protein n=1 Tax=Pedobacter frigoris TaxID=2571272 RepID=A0A4U1CJV9_9SPHI|nr:RagB/SusD family nutrient uptake outer membrane protein [Pedobacter frigoris]TKC07102.1 RagB/SusD family nutrient uptake outer membrane protein [Pedobacter frigoris]